MANNILLALVSILSFLLVWFLIISTVVVTDSRAVSCENLSKEGGSPIANNLMEEENGRSLSEIIIFSVLNLVLGVVIGLYLEWFGVFRVPEPKKEVMSE